MSAEAISAGASALSATIALFALHYARRQIMLARTESRRSTAFQIYKDYLKLAMENPDLSSPSLPKKAPGYPALKQNPARYEQYEFYVANLLFAAEGILDACDEDEWEATLIDQLSFHALYLREHDFRSWHYEQNILDLCTRAVAEYEANVA